MGKCLDCLAEIEAGRKRCPKCQDSRRKAAQTKRNKIAAEERLRKRMEDPANYGYCKICKERFYKVRSTAETCEKKECKQERDRARWRRKVAKQKEKERMREQEMPKIDPYYLSRHSNRRIENV